MHMTVRITVSLPDDVHATLVRVADASHISASAVVRAVLADVLPKMTGILDYLGTVKPEDAPAMVEQLDAWAKDMRHLMHDAPPVLGEFRTLLDEPAQPASDEDEAR
jgi:Arc/MetJ-type ribon-helix-helix transcriptional regulator